MMREVRVGNIKIGGDNPPVLIAGPCVIESEKDTIYHAQKIKKITDKLRIPFIFKSSYDKANRTSITSYRGPGLEEGLKILGKIKKEIGVCVLSDVHSKDEVRRASEVLDVIQIPAFLSRQTDLLLEAGRTGRAVNIKKGQFLSPWDIQHIITKIRSTGNKHILITERGTSFGYNNLVSDFRSIIIMRSFGTPVIYDASHSVQMPGGLGKSSGGDRRFIGPLMLAATSVGSDGIFVEVHRNPAKALCDGPNMLPLKELEITLVKLKKIRDAVKK
ncbi:MAG: 3-deoxy-8-phosphooctulonate synthase [Candidatus Omnitrophica bacterium]|nr:3-deoxy-8-phosphooctulonate synthase [Candidatus Omnitrophota bacterium]